MTALPSGTVEQRLAETRVAFDELAGGYDSRCGDNSAIQAMRGELWAAVERNVPPGARLLDLGCGTGVDAAHFAARGYRVVATDNSPGMLAQTAARARAQRVAERVEIVPIGLQALGSFPGGGVDAIYSDLGPLNCAPDLSSVAEASARLLAPGGFMVASVLGRICPWDWILRSARGDVARARLRTRRQAVPVSLDGNTVWTRYYTPSEFFSAFAARFERCALRALAVVAPPPYAGIYQRRPVIASLLLRLDRSIGHLPLLRQGGDHFLMVLRRRSDS